MTASTPSSALVEHRRRPASRTGSRRSRIFAFARTSRCAIVASATRNARAISPVVSPQTARSVSATCASAFKRGMAAREDQPQHVVGDELLVGLFRRLSVDLASACSSRCLCSQASAGECGRWPCGARPRPARRAHLRNAFGRPLRQRRRERVLQRILRIFEIAEEADQRRKRATRLGAKHVFDIGRASRLAIAQTGRISTQPKRAPGMRAAIALASSRSLASTR